MRRGLSLLEVLIASAVLAAAFLPIVASLHSMFRLAGRTQEATHGTFLARAVLERVLERLHDEDTRGAKAFFQSLAGKQTGPEALKITRESNPTLWRELKDAVIRVDVRTSDMPGPSLDADGDGTPEPDMCELHVEVSWPEQGHPRRQEVWTVLSRAAAP